jgi:hypothetical protein
VCFGGKGSVLTLTENLSIYGGDATTDLAAGTYNYTVTDANGCIATTSVTIDAVLHK